MKWSINPSRQRKFIHVKIRQTSSKTNTGKAKVEKQSVSFMLLISRKREKRSL